MAAHRKSLRESLAGIILAAGVAIILAPLAARAQCTVTDNSDDPSDTGSLPYCVAQANVAASAYTITFASSLNGQTITLTSGPLGPGPVPVTIQGPGAKLLTISGGNEVALFSNYYELTISGLTLANSGAPITNMGTLTVSNCTIQGTVGLVNSIGNDAIENQGTLTLSNSTISNNTGAAVVSWRGTTIVSNSTLSGNGDWGIYADLATLTVDNSTISGNSGTSPVAGGIYVYGGTANVSNSTISGNANLGIEISGSADVTVGNSTIFGNAGMGILVDYLSTPTLTLTVSNSTISGNTAYFVPGIYTSGVGTITLVNSIVAGNVSTGFPGSGDCGCGTQSPYNLINTQDNPVNPHLAPLGNYGGPTQSLLPLPGSPAICAGSSSLVPTGLSTDQRGFPRLNSSYTGYSLSSPCVDLGAVQTNYQSVQFPTPDAAYTGAAGTVISDPAYPVVSVTENSQNIGGVPVTLAISDSPSVGGVWTETTVSNSGATFNDLIVNSGGDYTLSATLGITPTSSVAISTASSANGNATLDVTPLPTNTSITGHTPNPSVVGQGVTVSFTVAPASPSGITPTGTVSASDGAGDSCTGPPSATPVSCTLIITTAGSKTLTATYSGDSNFAGSTGMAPQTQTVNPAKTTTSITSHMPTTAVVGQPVAIDFTVTAVAPGAGTPTGNVNVTDAAGDRCTAPVATGNCLMAFPSAGTKRLTATYAGDGNYGPSSSTAAMQNVVDFVISAQPQTEIVIVRGTTLYSVTLTPENGFAGVISLSCGEVPADCTCVVRPNSVSLLGRNSVTAQAWVTTDRTTPKGNHTLAFTGTYGSSNPSTGGLTHSADVTLEVR